MIFYSFHMLHIFLPFDVVVVHGKNGVKPIPCKVRLLVLCMVLKKCHLLLHGAHLLLCVVSPTSILSTSMCGVTYFCMVLKVCHLLLLKVSASLLTSVLPPTPIFASVYRS